MKEGQRIFMKSLDNKGAINIHKERKHGMDVFVAAQRLMQVGKLLQERNITYEVTATDAGPTGLTSARSGSPHSAPFMLQQKRSPTTSKMNKLKNMDWRDYYPLHNVYKFMDSLEQIYPSTCTVTSIGNSVEGRQIKMLKISNSDASNTAVWLDGAIHAREWISTSVVTYIADYIARNFNNLPTSITNKDWYFVPIVNPDGYHHTHILDRMWRKNRARVGSNVAGVDLNRNFSFYWGRSTNSQSSSGDPNHINYRGPEPFSEPESSAVKNIILYSRTPFKIFLSFHAYSEVICFPWCYTSEPCSDYVNLLEAGTVMAKAIYDTTGKMYKVGNFKDLMYYASGTSIDWTYGSAHVPYSYLIELRSKEHRFLLPKDEIEDCCKEILNAVKALAVFVDERK